METYDYRKTNNNTVIAIAEYINQWIDYKNRPSNDGRKDDTYIRVCGNILTTMRVLYMSGAIGEYDNHGLFMMYESMI